MGGAVSKPKILSRRELLALTQQPRNFVNHLFQLMITHLTPKDLLDLGNRAKCKDYVFVMADAIFKSFEAIRVIPTKDAKTGVLFYKKIGDLTKGVGGQQTYEHCLSLAYFYVRIFQIFGALALTVVDDPSSGQVIGYLQRGTEQSRPFQQQKPIIRGEQAVPFTPPLFRQGGSIAKGQYRELDKRLVASNLSLLRDLLTKYEEDERKYKLQFDANPRMKIYLFKRDNTVKIIYDLDNSNIVANFKISTRRNGLRNMALEDSNQYILSIGGITMTDETFSKVLKNISKTYTIRIDKVDDTLYAKLDSSSDEERQLTDKLEELFGKIEDEFEKRGVTVDRRNGDDQRGVRQSDRPSQYDVGVTEGLYTGFIQKYLEGKNRSSMPFCVARAIQLIDVNVLDFVNPTSIKTHICETNFEPIDVIPKPGSGLDSSVGLKSLNQLYYTKFYTDKKGEGDYQFQLKPEDAVPGEYLQFLGSLRDLFTTDTKAPTGKMSDLKMRDPGCDVSVKGKELQVTDPVAMRQIMQTVDTLFKLQVDHTKKVIEFMRTKLVEIKKNGGQTTVKLHPSLTKGGVTQINKLAYEARLLLADYYTKCERTYKLGEGVAKLAGKA